jgi:hypothetical protein
MATVGAVYTVDPYRRTAEDVVAALFRAPDYEPGPRPEPCHKRVWASLPQEGAEPRSSIDVVADWLWWEFAQRNPGLQRPTVCLCDGQEALWVACAAAAPDPNRVDILDLLHATPRLWQAAHLFCKEGSAEALAFVRERLERVLEGKVGYVVGGLRQMATKRGLKGSKRKRLGVICAYLDKNAHRMRYDEYLAKGYPIASGVIEGACRHYVKDRMERAGMHWTKAGAQAMLDVRSEYLNGDWTGFQRFRIEQETDRLYPQRHLLQTVEWTLAA